MDAVGVDGNVTDYNCPCTVHNSIAPLSALPFSEQGWGHHMFIHIYDIMNPGYVPPTKPVDFSPIELNHVDSEDSEFYMKVVNQYEDDILVYMDAPPARKDESVSGDGIDGGKWEGWTGPKKTMRGDPSEFPIESDLQDSDNWVSRITIASNEDPSNVSQPVMRVQSDGTPSGGFYVPKDHHLRIHIATEDQDGGWCQT